MSWAMFWAILYEQILNIRVEMVVHNLYFYLTRATTMLKRSQSFAADIFDVDKFPSTENYKQGDQIGRIFAYW
jgi:hypothetical protein